MFRNLKFTVFVFLCLFIQMAYCQIDLNLNINNFSPDSYNGQFFTSMVDTNGGTFNGKYIVSFNTSEKFQFQIKTALEVLEVRPIGQNLMVSTNHINNNFKLLNKQFVELATYSAIGFETDIHDWAMFENGDLLLIAYYFEPTDLTSWGGGDNVNVKHFVLQQINPNTNSIVKQIELRNYYNFDDILTEQVNPNFTSFDYLHINSIQIIENNKILIGNRNTSNATLINWDTENLIWHLGGNINQFDFLNDTAGFSNQHHISMKEDILYVFDNAVLSNNQRSSAVCYSINQNNFTVNQISRNFQENEGFSLFMGSVHPIENQSQIVCWGVNQNYQLSEFNESGEELFQAFFPSTDNYRVNPSYFKMEAFQIEDSTINSSNYYFQSNFSNLTNKTFEIDTVYAISEYIDVQINSNQSLALSSNSINFSLNNLNIDTVETSIIISAWYLDSIFVENQIPLILINDNIVSNSDIYNNQSNINWQNFENEIIIYGRYLALKSYQIYSLNGQLLENEIVNSDKIKLNKSNHPSLKVVNVKLLDGSIATKKLFF